MDSRIDGKPIGADREYWIDGRIVPMDNEGCAHGLADFIMNTELQKLIIDYLKKHDYGNEAEVEKLYQLV